MSLLWRLTAAAAVLMLAVIWAWLVWLVPYPGGVWLAAGLSLPVLICLPGLLRGSRYTHAGSSMLATFYMAFGLVEAYSAPASRSLALLTLICAAAWFVGALLYVRGSRTR